MIEIYFRQQTSIPSETLQEGNISCLIEWIRISISSFLIESYWRRHFSILIRFRQELSLPFSLIRSFPTQRIGKFTWKFSETEMKCRVKETFAFCLLFSPTIKSHQARNCFLLDTSHVKRSWVSWSLTVLSLDKNKGERKIGEKKEEFRDEKMKMQNCQRQQYQQQSRRQIRKEVETRFSSASIREEKK